MVFRQWSPFLLPICTHKLQFETNVGPAPFEATPRIRRLPDPTMGVILVILSPKGE